VTATRAAAEGAYFGWWNFATKLNLALAAGAGAAGIGMAGLYARRHGDARR